MVTKHCYVEKWASRSRNIPRERLAKRVVRKLEYKTHSSLELFIYRKQLSIHLCVPNKWRNQKGE